MGKERHLKQWLPAFAGMTDEKWIRRLQKDKRKKDKLLTL
jgi:hypothetical protein